MTVRPHFGKYGALWTYLVEHENDEVWATFDDIEGILGFRLPPSSRRQTSFWQSHRGSTFGRAVDEAGWRVVEVSLQAETVSFRRDLPQVAVVADADVADDTVYPLESSLLVEASWSQTGILSVQLADGSRHKYLNVPRSTFLALLSAPSPGRYFLADVKDKFAHEQA